MIKRLHSHLIHIALLAATLLAAVPAAGAAPAGLWEEIDRERTENVTLTDDSPLELTVREGVVHLHLGRPMTVEVFTILGQPVGRQHLRPGVYRLRLASRGIYILRAGGITRRITV